MDNKETDEKPASQFASELLTALAGDGSSLQRIVDLGSDWLRNPIIVTDKSWKAIAMTSHMDGTGRRRLE